MNVKCLILGGFLLCGLGAMPAMAEDCADGAGYVISPSKGGRFCKSKIKVNWFSAWSWCEAANGHLASVNDACLSGTGSCHGTYIDGQGVGVVWFSDSSSDSGAYCTNGSSHVGSSCGKASLSFALCAGSY